MLSLKRLYQQLKNSYHYCQAHCWRLYYGCPDKHLRIYGVSGTNGKTTTCIVLGSILRQAYGINQVGLLTTTFFWLGKQEETNATKMTTLGSQSTFKHLRQMVNRDVKHLVIEVTSHALDQNRLAGIKFTAAIILNLHREHLDYHQTMDNYARAKAKIMAYLSAPATLVINKKFPLPPAHRRTKTKFKIIKFSLSETVNVSTPLTGEWNQENVLAAKLLATAIGIKDNTIQAGIDKVTTIPGRMEWVSLGKNYQSTKNKTSPRVLIDYAVTPDALARVYQHISDHTDGKIFAVLGACGNRDRGKRPAMAAAVAKYANEIVLTREDPWTEDEEQIFTDLEKGLTGGNYNWRRIVDRREAIKYCLAKANLSDVIVVTGKGAEVGLAVGHTVIPWSDKKVITELLQERQSVPIKSAPPTNLTTTLFIDTSSAKACLALLVNGQIIANQTWSTGRHVGQEILIRINTILARHNINPQDIVKVAVHHGPSQRLSAQRAGVTVASLLAFACGAELAACQLHPKANLAQAIIAAKPQTIMQPIYSNDKH